jgi:hypothetical protein
MIESEATKVLAVLAAAFPQSRPLPEESERLWVRELCLEDSSYQDGLAGVQQLAREVAFFPSLAQLLRAAYEARLERVNREADQRRALGIGEVVDFIAMAPEEVQEALAPYWAKFGGREIQELRVAVERGDPEAKIEAGRRVAQRMIEAEADNEAEGQLKPLPKPGVIGRSSCGAAWGTPAEWDKAKRCYVCPSCRSPIRDGCNSSRESTG